MGLDLFDILMRTRRRLGVDINQSDINHLTKEHVPPDIVVGELFDLIWKRRFGNDEGHIESRLCPKCEIDLSKRPILSICPKCGAREPDESETWSILCALIKEVVGDDGQEISRQSLFRRDLGVH